MEEVVLAHASVITPEASVGSPEPESHTAHTRMNLSTGTFDLSQMIE